jgi:hypothetical protein
MISMKHLLMGVYQVCANKSPWVKLDLQRWGRGRWGLGGGLYTGERPQGHHGPLVSFAIKSLGRAIVLTQAAVAHII